MKYNFDEIVVRRGSNSIKWDDAEQEDVLPLWVADMDFKAAPAIREALARRVEHGVFGYTKVPDAYYDAINQSRLDAIHHRSGTCHLMHHQGNQYARRQSAGFHSRL